MKLETHTIYTKLTTFTQNTHTIYYSVSNTHTIQILQYYKRDTDTN